jgi:hypothetical protein
VSASFGIGMLQTSQPFATVLGATIAAVAGSLGAILTIFAQRRLEQERWRRENEVTLRASVTDAVRQLTIVMAGALHSMCWLGWAARFTPEQFTVARVRSYDAEMHRILPQIAGSLAAIVMIDSRAYAALKAIVDELYALDARLGAASHSGLSGAALAIAVAPFHQDAMTFENELPLRIGNVVKEATRRQLQW